MLYDSQALAQVRQRLVRNVFEDADGTFLVMIGEGYNNAYVSIVLFISEYSGVVMWYCAGRLQAADGAVGKRRRESPPARCDAYCSHLVGENTLSVK